MDCRAMTIRFPAPAACALLIVVSAAASAQAQSLDDSAWIELGAFWADVDSTGEFRLPDQPTGVTFDFEQDLGLDDRRSLFSVNAGARAFGRVVLGADYYALNRDNAVELGRDIQFEDVIFPVAAEIESGFDSDIYRLTIGYALIRDARLEFGPAVGLHATSFDIFVAGEARVGSTEFAEAVRRRDFLAPLPTIGLYGTWQPTARLTAALGHRLQQDLRHIRREIGASGADCRNGRIEMLLGVGLENVAAGAGGYALVHRRVVIAHGEEKDADLGRILLQPPRERQPIDLGQGDVEHGDIRAFGQGEPVRGLAVGGLPHDSPGRVGLYDVPHAPADNLMVIRQKYP